MDFIIKNNLTDNNCITINNKLEKVLNTNMSYSIDMSDIDNLIYTLINYIPEKFNAILKNPKKLTKKLS